MTPAANPIFKKETKKYMVGRIDKNLGFTILEIPVSLFIIGVVLVIYAAASNTVVLNRHARHQDLAHRIATSEMEDLRDVGYDLLPPSGSFSNALLGSLPSSSANVNVADYNADTKQVDITVTWQEPGSDTVSTANLSTLITKNGL
jgi:hypothetical protein